MTPFESAALILTATALFGWANERTLKLPTPIGVTLVALAFSLGLLLFAGEGVVAWSDAFLSRLDFDVLVMEGMLSFLLFAGALHIDLDDLRPQAWPILLLATLGVTVSTFLVGGMVFLLAAALGLSLPFVWALVFGALISPTDPIAVLGILRSLGVRRDVETLIVGESLFNDGVGVVVYLAVLGVAIGGGGHAAGAEQAAGLWSTGALFLQEAGGGVLFGLAAGYACFRLLKSIDNYTVEILLTLALVAGGYALALALHLSGPLAMVVAGLLIGNRGRTFAMSDRVREHLDTFWELVDEILNAVLFVLIGLEVLVLARSAAGVQNAWWVGLAAIPLVLLARLATVGGTINLLRLQRAFPPWTVRTMVWGGLRGGISIALALALPAGPERELILPLTYAVVVFAILVQGLTVSRVAGRIPARDRAPTDAAPDPAPDPTPDPAPDRA